MSIDMKALNAFMRQWVVDKLDQDKRSHFFRLVRQGWKPKDALRIASGPMGGNLGPVLTGLDSGADGFMRNRQENDGCPDSFTRERVRRNAGGSLGGGVFVPGLCRPGVPFDGYAVCRSRDEVVKKARKLGVGVRGPGINVEPREQAPVEDDGVPSERAIQYTLREEVIKHHGGKITGKKYKELVEKLTDRHSRKRPPMARSIDALYPAEMARRIVPEKELIG